MAEELLGFKVFPHIRRVALEIAYDNGMINSGEPEELFLEKAHNCIITKPLVNLALLNGWVGTLSAEQIDVLATGEEQEMKRLTESSPDPAFCDQVFNQIFEVG